jgi:hypothetical protein
VPGDPNPLVLKKTPDAGSGFMGHSRRNGGRAASYFSGVIPSGIRAYRMRVPQEIFTGTHGRPHSTVS